MGTRHPQQRQRLTLVQISYAVMAKLNMSLAALNSALRKVSGAIQRIGILRLEDISYLRPASNKSDVVLAVRAHLHRAHRASSARHGRHQMHLAHVSS